MAYIDADGNIVQRAPWGPTKAKNIFWGILNFVYAFFLTLFNPSVNKHGEKYKTDYRKPPGQGPPRPPQRRMGGFGNEPHQIPTCMPGGG